MLPKVWLVLQKRTSRQAVCECYAAVVVVAVNTVAYVLWCEIVTVTFIFFSLSNHKSDTAVLWGQLFGLFSLGEITSSITALASPD